MKVRLDIAEKELFHDNRSVKDIITSLAQVLVPNITYEQLRESVLGGLASLDGTLPMEVNPNILGLICSFEKHQNWNVIEFYTVPKTSSIEPTQSNATPDPVVQDASTPDATGVADPDTKSTN